METVLCKCRECDANIGQFVNLWSQIGKTYFSPVVESDDELAVLSQGDVRVGERGTLVEQCHLQDIVCGIYSAVIGLRCVETPVNHVLDENQVLLRRASVELIDACEGETADFNIKRVLDVKEPSKAGSSYSTGAFQHGAPHATAFSSSSAFPGIVDILKLQADLEGQRNDINRIDSNGFKLVSSLDKRVARVETEASKLTATVSDLRHDVGGVQEDLTSLKSEVTEVKRTLKNHPQLTKLEESFASVTNSLADVRQEIGSLADQLRQDVNVLRNGLQQNKREIKNLKSSIGASVSTSEYAKDVIALRSELAQLRRQIDDVRSTGPERISLAPFPSRELDILTSNIAKISNRASQVETLQMELEILKGRVERAEANSQPTDDRRVNHLANSRDMPSYANTAPPRSKRPYSSTDREPEQNFSKRPAFSGFSDSPAEPYPVQPYNASPKEPNIMVQEEQPQTEVNPRTVKLTKAGKVDRRSLRSRNNPTT